MRQSWPRVRLGEVLSQDTEYIEGPEPRTYSKLSVRLYGKGVVLDSPMDGARLKMKRHQIAKAGQVILSEIWGKKGAIGFVPPQGAGALCTSHFFLFDVQRNKLDPEWLRAIFAANYLQEQLGADAQGTTGYAAVRPRTLLACEIPLPSLGEQRRIVARIEELAAKIAEARSLRHQAIEEAGAVVTSLHASLAGERTRRLADLLILDEDAVPVIPTGQYPQVGVRGFGGGLFSKAAVQGINTTYKTFNRLYRGALVLSQVKGWEGAVAVCDECLDGWFVSPEYRTFRCVPSEARPGYLAALIRTEWFWGKLQHATRGVGARRERTRPEQFLALRIPMPDVHQQETAEAVFKGLDALRGLQAETATELDAMLPAILDRAFKGEL
jgi:type I restriction enzyme, S subunit